MTNQELQKKIVVFWMDVAYLGMKGISNNEMGDRMPGVGRSNFSKYFNQTNTITEDFLKNFYVTWGPELEGKPVMEETEESYNVRDLVVLKLVEAQNKLIDGQNRLIGNNTALVETNQMLINRLFDRGQRQDGSDG